MRDNNAEYSSPMRGRVEERNTKKRTNRKKKEKKKKETNIKRSKSVWAM